MNKIIKMLVKETIHNNRVNHQALNIGDKYTVFDKSGRQILYVINGWATNNYSIFVNNRNILAVHWDQSNSKPLTPEQKDMVDIINACKEKIDLQETAQTMNGNELELANFLQQSLCNLKH